MVSRILTCILLLLSIIFSNILTIFSVNFKLVSDYNFVEFCLYFYNNFNNSLNVIWTTDWMSVLTTHLANYFEQHYRQYFDLLTCVLICIKIVFVQDSDKNVRH